MMLSSNALSVIVAAVASGKVARWQSGRVAAKVSCNLCNKSSRQRVAVGSKLRAAAALKNCCENSQEKILSFPFWFFFCFLLQHRTHTARIGRAEVALITVNNAIMLLCEQDSGLRPLSSTGWPPAEPSRGAHSVRLISRPCFACSCCP